MGNAPPQRTPRARLVGADGTEQGVTADVVGLDAFVAALAAQADQAPAVRVSGWQACDEEHPAKSGTSAYRIVYKTMRVLPWPALRLEWPNLSIFFGNGDVDRGGVRIPSALPGRNPDQVIIPEFGRLYGDGGLPRYIRCVDANVPFNAWQESLAGVSFVEIIRHAEGFDGETESPFEEVLREGRAGVAAIKVMIELGLGRELLAMPLAEEVGEAFGDWHWNRRLDSQAVSVEGQAPFVQLSGQQIAEVMAPPLEALQAVTPKERGRIRLASQWFWRADADPDPTTRFIAYWLVLEILAMPDTTDIKPLRQRVVELSRLSGDTVKTPIGQLFGLRSTIVHHGLGETSPESEALIVAIARMLLEHAVLGQLHESTRETFASTLAAFAHGSATGAPKS